jgi:4a-hydroxytetrahydrobiopterin dehydratase
VAARALTTAEIERALDVLNSGASTAWSLVDGKLHKVYSFENFVAAFGFMTQVALVAERMDHHPEWFNVYRTVRVDLATHEARGLTSRDFALAEAMDAIAARIGGGS